MMPNRSSSLILSFLVRP